MAEPAIPGHADVVVVRRRPGPALAPGDLVTERRPLREPGPGEVVVRNIVTSVDPYQLRMLRGSAEVTPVAIGDPVPANSVGVVVRSHDPAVPVGTQVATYTGWQSYATTTVAPDEIADRALGAPLDWISVLSTTGDHRIRRDQRYRPRPGRADACWSARPPAPSAGSPSSWRRRPAHG